jgi:hypothetical protein
VTVTRPPRREETEAEKHDRMAREALTGVAPGLRYGRRLAAANAAGLVVEGLEHRTLELKGKSESTEVVVLKIGNPVTA